MKKIFGTDGVRGIASSQLTPQFVFKLISAAVSVFFKDFVKLNKKPKALIGKDTRNSCDMLESLMAAKLCELGVDAYLVGIIPTPGIAFLVKHGFDVGIMISASHNPPEYNGIKFFDNEGYKLTKQVECKIEQEFNKRKKNIKPKMDLNFGRVFIKPRLKNKYEEFIKSSIDTKIHGMKVAIDAANGSASPFAKKIFESLGAKVYVINDKPDGTNINKNSGSTYIKTISDYVKSIGADVGLAFDGDADRVLFCDENGALVDGDKIMAICAIDMKKKNILHKNTIVTTIMSNFGLILMGKKHEIDIINTKVGDRNIVEEMLKGNYNFGGEQSGHIIFLDYNTTGDAFITALKFLSIIKESNKKLSNLASVVSTMPQIILNVKVEPKKKYDYLKNDEIISKIKSIEEKFKKCGRVLVRASGTEALVRVMVEGEHEETIKCYAKELACLIREKLS